MIHLRQVPRIQTTAHHGPRIVYNSAKKAYRTAKYIYHIQAFKPGKFDAAKLRISDGKLTIIAHCELRNDRHNRYNHRHHPTTTKSTITTNILSVALCHFVEQAHKISYKYKQNSKDNSYTITFFTHSCNIMSV